MEDIPYICVNSGSTIKIHGSNNWLYDCDQYGWCDEYWWYNNITVKRPDGSIALVIDPEESFSRRFLEFSYCFQPVF
ncbi:MAG: hypothetical protein IPH69_15475 [Bacteroidales bacterium]|nr:hypothetical protein [Bacteroidales bacterium]